jgi:hypothetical protein
MMKSQNTLKSRKSRNVIAIGMLNTQSARSTSRNAVAVQIVHAAKVHGHPVRKSRRAAATANPLRRIQSPLMPVLHVVIRQNQNAAFGARMMLNQALQVPRHRVRQGAALILLQLGLKAESVSMSVQAGSRHQAVVR